MVRYNIDFLQWLWRVLPRPLQRKRTAQVLWVFLAPLRRQHAELMDWGEGLLYELKWNGQTNLLEAMLRLELGDELIRLENISRDTSGAFVGLPINTKSKVGNATKTRMYLKPGSGVGVITGIVHVPRYLEGKEQLLRALLHKYKLEQVNYIIQYFD